MTLILLQFLIFFLGLSSIGLAVYYFAFFYQSRRKISRAMRAFLIEQVISASCTLAFSINSLMNTVFGVETGSWNSIDPTMAITLRALMFTAMLHSTVRLSIEIQRIIDENA